MISKNAVGLVVLLFSVMGVEVNEGDAMELISAFGTIVSFGLLIWNQVGRSDVAGFFFKK